VGDLLTPEFSVASNKPSAGGSVAVVEFAVGLFNQAGESILKGRHVYLLRRGPQSK
jgi:hypothetical protein